MVGKNDLADYVTANPQNVYKFHTSCREGLKYNTRKAHKSTHESISGPSRITCHVTGGFMFKDMFLLRRVHCQVPGDIRKVKIY